MQLEKLITKQEKEYIKRLNAGLQRTYLIGRMAQQNQHAYNTLGKPVKVDYKIKETPRGIYIIGEYY